VSHQRQIFPQTILRIAQVSDRGPVPVSNGSDAVYAISADGRRWIKKVLLGNNELLAEALGWLLSNILKIPTPLGAVCGTGTDATWLSESVVPVTHWEPSRAQCLKNPDDLGAMLALDAVIGNWDRHSGNLLLRPENTQDQLKVYSIDVAGSWIGTPSDIGRRGLEVPSVDNLAPGIPVDMVREGAEKCAHEFSRLDPTLLNEYVSEACEIATVTAVDAISEALRRRSREAPGLVQRYLDKIEART